MVLAFGLSGALAAQGTSTQTTPQSQRQGMDTAATASVTVEGCLVREKDVPGREPNVAERAGVMEDYILTNVKWVKGSPHSMADAHTSGAHASGTSTGSTTGTSATGTTGATGAATGEQTAGTSGIGAAVMLEIRGLDDEKLQPLVGQRVQIEGRVNPQDFAERQREKVDPSGEKAGDLPELHGMVIKKAESAEPCTVK